GWLSGAWGRGPHTIDRFWPARPSSTEAGASALCLKEIAVFISEAYAQAAAPAAQGASGGLMGMLPLVLMFVVLYFVMIRPQMKRQKETKAMLEALAKGDEVVTQDGVIGKITKLGDTFVSVEVANGVELQLQRVAIVQVLPKGTYNKQTARRRRRGTRSMNRYSWWKYLIIALALVIGVIYSLPNLFGE